MNKFTVIILLIVVFASSCKQPDYSKQSFNQDWKFKVLKDTDAENTLHQTEYNDAAWEDVSLPHTAHLEPLIVNDQWQGTCWYRKSFNVDDKKGKLILLELEAAMNHSKIWVNGELVKVQQGGYLPVVLDLSKYVKYGESNVIAIRLNNTDNAVTGPKPLHKLDFNMYGGLYRNAWLITKNKVHISHPLLANKVAGGGVFITTPKVAEESSIVQVKTHVNNENRASKQVSLVHRVFFKDELIFEEAGEEQTVAGNKSFEFINKFKINAPKLWSPDAPHLYTLETIVQVNGKVKDLQHNKFGIREFKFIDNNLYVNGEKTYLRGVNRHQEYPFVGYALSDNAQYRDAYKIKEAGFNCIRLSHYPQSPAFMDACDELGLITIDAILGWQYYLDSDPFRAYCYRSARNLVRRDRNHPSVLSWEVSLNETKMPEFFMQKLHDIVHREYPSELTYSCGWMDDVYDIYFQARQHRIMHHYDSVQHKPYFVSEYGDWEYHSKNPGLNQHKFNDILRAEKSSRQLRSNGESRMIQQAINWQESHNDNHSTVAFGDGYWVMYDYNRGYHNDIESSGVMDIFRLPKLGHSFFQSQRSPQDSVILQIASNWTKDSPLDVKVYSNCDTVELYLNDVLISRQGPDDDSISTNLTHPPFTFSINKFSKGTLKAVAYLNGEMVAKTAVHTPEKAEGLKVWFDESGRLPQAGVNDLIFVYIAAIDANGTILSNYEGEVTIATKSDLQIMNQGPITLEAGIGTALIKVGEVSRNIHLNVQVDDFTERFTLPLR